MANGWVAQTETWSVISSTYQQTSGSGTTVSVYNQAGYTNFTFSTQVPGWDSGLIVRNQDVSNYYYVWISGSGALQLKKRVGGSNSLVFTATTGVSNATHTLKVTTNGTSFSLYLDGNLQGSGNDSTFSSGKVGLRTWQRSATFDDAILSLLP